MSEILPVPSRRGFLAGLVAFTAAAPAIVKASSLMPVRAPKLVGWDLGGPDYSGITEYYNGLIRHFTLDDYSARILEPMTNNLAEQVAAEIMQYDCGNLLSVDQVTREAMKLWNNSNAFIQNIDRHYDEAFDLRSARIGSTLRIRLPADHEIAGYLQGTPSDA